MIPFTHHRTFWQRWLEIVGMAQPELQSAYEPGWVKRDLPPLDEEKFDAVPKEPAGKKRRGK